MDFIVIRNAFFLIDMPDLSLLPNEKTEKIESIIIAVIGTDANIGNRTTSIKITDHLKEEGYKT